MKKIITILLIIINMNFLFPNIEQFKSVPARSRVKYFEEFYSLYKLNMHYNTDNLLANIHWLQIASFAKFEHPIRAFALIRSEAEHEKYKNLFRMRVNFLIMQSYLMLGRRYDKENIYYFNVEHKKELLQGFEIARVYYKRAFHYWQETEKWAGLSWKLKHFHLIGSEMDKMQNEMFRIVTKDKWINHAPIIEKLLLKLDQKETSLKQDQAPN